MRVLLDTDRCVLFQGEAKDLPLSANSVDAIVTDPPSGTGFMAQQWDKSKGGRDGWIDWLALQMTPALNALKPAGHGLVWALPRTSYWTAMGLDDCGFAIRDRVSHIFLNGFPKSLTSKSSDIPAECGTALKPALEDWWLVQKPVKGSTTNAFHTFGTGLLNIDVCRIGDDDTRGATGTRPSNGWGMGEGVIAGNEHGRWPPHLLVGEGVEINDIDDPATYFYCPKPTPKETELGLDHLPLASSGTLTGRQDGSLGLNSPRAGAGRGTSRRNIHPTKKSVGLMRYLIRLITPPGGIVLDLFAGSGTTGVAALLEGRKFIGVELGGDNGEYLPILEGRIRHALANT